MNEQTRANVRYWAASCEWHIANITIYLLEYSPWIYKEELYVIALHTSDMINET